MLLSVKNRYCTFSPDGYPSAMSAATTYELRSLVHVCPNQAAVVCEAETKRSG